MSTDNELREIRQHLDRMEGRTKWLRREAWLWRLCCLATLLVVGYFVMLETGYRALPTPKEVKCDTLAARRIGVFDEAGKLRIAQTVADNDIATVGIWNSDGKLLATLGTHPRGGLILLQSHEGVSTVTAGFYTQGSPGYVIKDVKGTARAQLSLEPAGPGLVFRDEAGNITLTPPAKAPAPPLPVPGLPSP
jgi:hypothetical protein